MWNTVLNENMKNKQIKRSSLTNLNLLSNNKEFLKADNIETIIKLNSEIEQNILLIESQKLKKGKKKKFVKENEQLKKNKVKLDSFCANSMIETNKNSSKTKLNYKNYTAYKKIKRRTYEHFEFAIITDDCNKMTLLLKDNPNLNFSHQLRSDENTFLHTAVLNNCSNALSWLAARCSITQLNQQNFSGDSPLHLAVKKMSPNLVNILLHYQACNHVKNLNNETPLHLALNLYIENRNTKKDTILLNTKYSCQNQLNSGLNLNNELFKSQIENISFFLNLSNKFYDKDLFISMINKNFRRNCCVLGSQLDDINIMNLMRQLTNKQGNETFNNCRLMRKIVMSILHDSDPISWEMLNEKGKNIISISEEYHVDFVLDFISKYHKLTIIMKPEHQVDQNGNYLLSKNSQLESKKEEIKLNEYSENLEKNVLKNVNGNQEKKIDQKPNIDFKSIDDEKKLNKKNFFLNKSQTSSNLKDELSKPILTLMHDFLVNSISKNSDKNLTNRSNSITLGNTNFLKNDPHNLFTSSSSLNGVNGLKNSHQFQFSIKYMNISNDFSEKNKKILNKNFKSNLSKPKKNLLSSIVNENVINRNNLKATVVSCYH